MNRIFIKKLIYKLLGEKSYAKAYSKGKILDIKKGNNLEPESTLLQHFIGNNSVVLDIGANYGHYTYLMAQLTKNSVFAFEPIPFTYSVLENIKAEFKLENVTLHNAAVSDKDGKIEMSLPLLSYGAPNTGIAFIGKTASLKSKIVTVPLVKIDDLAIEGPIDFIKIDIEGHEPEAFIGMEKLLMKHHPVVLIEFSHNCLNRAGKSPNTFSQYLKDTFGYHFFTANNECLIENKEEVPSDGYYFLIPSIKVNNFNRMIIK